jgi:hypothetical protein
MAEDLCKCGKPKSHGGMCSVRWAVRKANNGPTGRKADMVPQLATAVSEEAIARRLFGDLADDVLALRKHGHIVARFKDGFRVDRDVLSADQLIAKVKKYKAGPEQDAATTRAPSKDALQAVRTDEPPATSARGAGPRVNSTDLRARVAQLEQQVEHLFAVVADAIKGRRETLVDQAKGLAEIETTLRNAA